MKTAIHIAVVSLFLCLICTTNAHAMDKRDGESARGILDTVVLADGASLTPAERRQQRRDLRREARIERRKLRRMSERNLRRVAARGERLAQLVLAERLADEALRWVDNPTFANDALSEALSWYATAARRGLPGSSPTDGLLPAPVVRVVRPRP